MFWHIDADIISLLVLAAIYGYSSQVQANNEQRRPQRRFRWCLRVGLLVTIVDIAASLAMDLPTPTWLYHLLMTGYMALIELSIVCWFLYAISILYYDDLQRARWAARLSLLPYALYLLAALSTPWSGLFYSLSADGVYQRGPWFFATVLFYAVYTLALLIMVISRRHHAPSGYSITILILTPLILGAGVAAQLLIPGWLMIMPAYMLSMVTSFLFLQKRRARDQQTQLADLSRAALTDALTGLYNRAGMEYQVQRGLQDDLGRRCLVIVVDVDDLKQINDSLGHPEGDRAIQAVGLRLRQCFRAHDPVARFGGDEFVVYLVGELNELQIRRSLKQLVLELGQLRVGPNDDVPVSASAGASWDVVGGMDFATLCAQADAALYQAKKQGKNCFALYAPGMEQDLFAAAQVGEAELERTLR